MKLQIQKCLMRVQYTRQVVTNYLFLQVFKSIDDHRLQYYLSSHYDSMINS